MGSTSSSACILCGGERCYCPITTQSKCSNPIPAPMFSIVPQHWGRSLYSGPIFAAAAHRVVFSTNAPSDIPSSSFIMGPSGPDIPAFATAALFVGMAGSLYAIDSSNQAIVCVYRTPPFVKFISTPALASWGILYAGGSDGILYAFAWDLCGSPLYTVELGAQISAALTICAERGMVIVASINGNVYALNATGTILWTYSSNAPVYSSPAFDETCERVFFGNEDSIFFALNASTGLVLWTWPTAGPISGSPVVANGFTYVGSMLNDLYAFDILSGMPSWEIAAASGAGVTSTPTLGDSAIFVGTLDGSFLAGNGSASQSVVWNVTLNGSIVAPAVLDASGNLFVGTSSGTLYSLSQDGEIRWSILIGEPILSPVIVSPSGSLYLPSFQSPAG
jgi:eukaryotic-like serine/threonine-protein kinase